MPIIKDESDYSASYINQYPNFFTPEDQKYTPKEIKRVMDYFAGIAYKQYQQNHEAIEKNYSLLKGVISRKDFYEPDHPDTGNFVDTLLKSVDLPRYVKHYSIMNPPINAMVGELTARADGVRIKALDDDSRNEELAEKTRFLQAVIENKIREKNIEFLQQQGFEPDSKDYNEQLQSLTSSQIQDYLSSYTSTGEKWANHVHTALKTELSIKEKSEEAYKDLLVCSRQYYHLYMDKSRLSPLGFNVEVANPKSVWSLSALEKKYITDAHASGLIEVMELSDILNRFDLSIEEIEYLQKQASNYFLEGNSGYDSNLVTGKSGPESITYDTFDPLLVRKRQEAEAELMAESQLNTFLGLSGAGYASYGNKFTVVQAYWLSKRKVGRLTYVDENGRLAVTLVDSSYKKVSSEISIEWTWENVWWKGTKIGPHVYVNVEPLKYLDYSPIIGVVFENKNSPVMSLVDQMKPFQVLYDICMNQLYELLKKDLGMVIVFSPRYIPKPKDGDYTDALDQWEEEARRRGIVFVDDSPENLKGGGGFQQTGRQDLSRHAEIQARYNTAIALKAECWELAGFSKERLGSIAATQTATGTQAALSRSFAQTEPYFACHYNVLIRLYQAMLDTAQYLESKKPLSTISYLTNIGENAFIQVTGPEIKLRDFHIYPTNAAEDQRNFDDLRSLAQPMLQNGVSAYDIATMYSTNSVRQLRESMKKIKDREEQFIQQQQQLQQQQLQQQQQQYEEGLRQQELIRQETIANDNYQRELDRISKKEIALIQTFNRQRDNLVDKDNNGTPDLLQISQLGNDISETEKKHTQALAQISLEREKLQKDREMEQQRIELEKQKLRLQEKQMKNDLKIAQYYDKGVRNTPK